MQVSIKYKPITQAISVRRISWQQRCEEQLNKIINKLNGLKADMEESVSKIKEYAAKVYGEEYPDLTENTHGN